ncbi:MAG: hypothetical protein IPK26_29830 [Planctomycetes bacterium]|nr:hypothetical protein [Planctomycetota bacterium]
MQVADLGTCVHTGGTTRVYGTVNGNGGTLQLTAATTGSWQTHSGTIQNATIQATGGTELQIWHGTLDGCTIAAGTTVRVTNGGYSLTARNTVGAANAITNHGTIILDWGYLHAPLTTSIAAPVQSCSAAPTAAASRRSTPPTTRR